MEKPFRFTKKLWRILFVAEAIVFALLAALRLTGVLSFRLAILPLTLVLFAVLDGVLCAVIYDVRHRNDAAYRARRRVLLVVLAIAVVASVPLMTSYLPEGHDIQFHLFRIEGVRDGLVDGQLPVRIHPNTLFGNGYANPAFYPELLLYFPALLRLCGFSVMAAYKAFLFLLNLLTAAIACYCVSRIFKSVRIGLLGSALYTLSLYRLVNLYTRAAVGEASAMTFLPLIALGLYAILTDDPAQPQFRRAFWPLTAGMAGLVGTHLLSCEMVLPLLAVVCLVCIRRVLQPRRILSVAVAAAFTVLLGLSFLVPMLDYMGYDTYRVFAYSVTDRAHEAVNVAQLFPLFPNATGESLASVEGAAGEMPLGVGFVFALVLVAFPVLRAAYKRAGNTVKTDRPRMALLCYALSLVLLWMSTNLFPWTGVFNMGGLPAQLASMLQFPWRFHALTTVLATLVACECIVMAKALPLPRLARTLAAVACAVLLVSTAAYTDDLMQTGKALIVRTSADLDQMRSVGDAEYLPSGAEGSVAKYRLAEPNNATDGLTVSDFSRKGTHIALYVQNDANSEGSVDLPLVYYLGYRIGGYTAQSAGEPAPTLIKGADARIRLTVPAGYAGSVTLRFYERPLWRVAEAVSLLSLVALTAWCVINRRKYPAPCVLDTPVEP